MSKPGGHERGARRLIWSDRALNDLEALGDYIAKDDPETADSWVSKLRDKAESIPALPMRGRRVPEFGLDEYREVLVRNYRIVYHVGAGSIEILAIVEGHRLLVVDRGGDGPEGR